MKKVYIDSCVYISYLRGEVNDKSYFLFERIFDREFIVVLSKIILKEVFKKKDIKFKFIELLDELKEKNIFDFIERDIEDKKKAEELDIHSPDDLNIILAIKSNCDFLITNDNEYFKFQNKILVKHPKDF